MYLHVACITGMCVDVSIVKYGDKMSMELY